MTASVHHPVFAWMYGRVLSPLMEHEMADVRQELLAGLSGRVLEVGAGAGANFAHYPPTVAEVLALEPEPYLRTRAQRAAAGAPVPVSVRDGVAEALPVEAASFDAAVASLVLCSVADLPGAVAELRRALKPGGELRFLEHVRSERRRKARVQSILDRSGVWPWLGGGCHCARETLAAIERGQFGIARARRLDLGPPWMHTNPFVLGAATPQG
jgi:SAM-dependent methyltransferase